MHAPHGRFAPTRFETSSVCRDLNVHPVDSICTFTFASSSWQLSSIFAKCCIANPKRTLDIRGPSMSTTLAAPVLQQPYNTTVPPTELDFYAHVARLEAEVLAGRHPTIKLPEAAIREHSRFVNDAYSLPAAQSSLVSAPAFVPPLSTAQHVTNNAHATPTQAVYAPIVNGFSDSGAASQVPPAQNSTPAKPLHNGIPAQVSHHPKTTSLNAPNFSSSIDPVLLTKSDDLVRAENRLKRQRIERALKDSAQQAHKTARRSREDGADEELLAAQGNFNVTDILERALVLVKPVSGLRSPVVERASPANAPSDDNSYYSSQGNSWASQSPPNDVDATVVHTEGIVPRADALATVRRRSSETLEQGQIEEVVPSTAEALITRPVQALPVYGRADRIVSTSHPLPPRPAFNDSTDESYSPPVAVNPDLYSALSKFANNSSQPAFVLPGLTHTNPEATGIRDSESYSPPPPPVTTVLQRQSYTSHLTPQNPQSAPQAYQAAPQPTQAAPQTNQPVLQAAHPTAHDLRRVPVVQADRNPRKQGDGRPRNRNDRSDRRKIQRQPRLDRTIQAEQPLTRAEDSAPTDNDDDLYVPIDVAPLVNPRKRPREQDTNTAPRRASGKRMAIAAHSPEPYIKPEPISPPQMQDLTGVPESMYPRRLVLREDGRPELQIYSPNHKLQRAAESRLDTYPHGSRLISPRDVSHAYDSDAYGRSERTIAPVRSDLRRIASVQHASRLQARPPYPVADLEEVAYSGSPRQYIPITPDHSSSVYADVPLPYQDGRRTLRTPFVDNGLYDVVERRARTTMPPPPPPPAATSRRMVDEYGVEWVAAPPASSLHVEPLPQYLESPRSTSQRHAPSVPYPEDPVLPRPAYPRYGAVDSGYGPLIQRPRGSPYEDSLSGQAEDPQEEIINKLERQMQLMNDQIRSLRAASRATSRMPSIQPSPIRPLPGWNI